MDSSPEELEIPILHNFRSQKFRSQVRGFCDSCMDVVCIWLAIAVPIFVVFLVIDRQMSLTSYEPEIRLDSLFVCSTNTSDNNLLIWDLKFNITNPNNYSDLYTRFEVSIFSYNQTKLLTKPAYIAEMYVGPNNHTSATALADAYIKDPNDLTETNGTIRFDLKIRGAFEFYYFSASDDQRGDLVCGDVKVALSTSFNKTSCGKMLGDPFACSYQRYYKKHFWDYLFNRRSLF